MRRFAPLAREGSFEIMDNAEFADHYEVMQLSPNADGDTVERVYRLLAKRYHPDNKASGDEERFRRIRQAYEVLSDPDRRAEFDVGYDDRRGTRWQIFEQSAAMDDQEQDRRIFHGVLSLLYAARRRDPKGGGLGSIHLEEMLGVPREHLEFPIWYLRQRGLVENLPSGELAITVEGIDSLQTPEMTVPDNRLLEGSGGTGRSASTSAARANAGSGSGANGAYVDRRSPSDRKAAAVS